MGDGRGEMGGDCDGVEGDESLVFPTDECMETALPALDVRDLWRGTSYGCRVAILDELGASALKKLGDGDVTR